MKKTIFAVVAICSAVCFAEEKCDKETIVQDLVLQGKSGICASKYNDIENEVAVLSVFGEGTNSSFLVKTELTATQKRFLALGRHMLAMSAYIYHLEKRIKALEKDKEGRDYMFEKMKKAAKLKKAEKDVNGAILKAESSNKKKMINKKGVK